MVSSGASTRSSPTVVNGTISAASAGSCPRMRPSTWSVCQRASALARVPILTVGRVAIDLERAAQAADVRFDLARGALAQRPYGVVQQPVHEPARELVQRFGIRLAVRQHARE